MYYDKLKAYKQTVIKDRRINILVLCINIVFFATFVYGAFFEPITVLFAVIAMIPMIVFIGSIRENGRVIRQLSDIEKNRSLKRTTEIKLSYPKVRFIAKPEVYARPHMIHDYCGIKLIGENGRKYYYFFDTDLHYDKESIKSIQNKFSQELYVQCYENTAVIKTVDSDPDFLCIKNGRLVT